MDNWFGAKFDHLAVTGYALTGMHATLECTACHANNKFKGTPSACLRATRRTSPGPTTRRTCRATCRTIAAVCHSTTDWLNAKFDHTAFTGYALTGMHATLTCVQCHVNNQYVSTPTDCYSCHKADFAATTNPNHVATGMPTNCSICHTTSAWSPSSFDHSRTAFP